MIFPSPRLPQALRGLLALLASAVAAHALHAQANVTWSTPAAIAGDSDVSTTGSLVWAYNFTSDSTSPTVNGVTFNAVADSTADLTFTTTSGSNFSTNPSAFGSGALFYTALSSNYQALLQSAAYWDVISFSTPDQVTLNNLTPGRVYSLQIWVNDSRPGYFDRVNAISDGGGHDVSVHFNNGSSASLGQYVIGTFTASGTTQELDFSPASGNAIQLNAMTLAVAVPEPSTCAFVAGLGSLGLVCWRRRTRLAKPGSLACPA
jgi:hypothetical protein